MNGEMGSSEAHIHQIFYRLQKCNQAYWCTQTLKYKSVGFIQRAFSGKSNELSNLFQTEQSILRLLKLSDGIKHVHRHGRGLEVTSHGVVKLMYHFDLVFFFESRSKISIIRKIRRKNFEVIARMCVLMWCIFIKLSLRSLFEHTGTHLINEAILWLVCICGAQKHCWFNLISSRCTNKWAQK